MRPQFNSWVWKIPWRRDRLPIPIFMDFPGGADGKESACNVRDLGLIPGLGRTPGGGPGNPLLCSCLVNPHGLRSRVGYSPWGHKESDLTEGLNTRNGNQLAELQRPWVRKMMSPTLLGRPWWSVPQASAPSDCGVRGGHSGWLWAECSVRSSKAWCTLWAASPGSSPAPPASRALLCGCGQTSELACLSLSSDPACP